MNVGTLPMALVALGGTALTLVSRTARRRR
jgi:hypothetical protein